MILHSPLWNNTYICPKVHIKVILIIQVFCFLNSSRVYSSQSDFTINSLMCHSIWTPFLPLQIQCLSQLYFQGKGKKRVPKIIASTEYMPLDSSCFQYEIYCTSMLCEWVELYLFYCKKKKKMNLSPPVYKKCLTNLFSFSFFLTIFKNIIIYYLLE